MNPTSKPLTISLNGKAYKLHFDLNTFTKFEEVTGKFFLDFLATVQERVEESKKKKDPMLLLRGLSIQDVRAFIWAALHTYDANNEPVWPLTIGQLGSLIDVNNMSTLLPVVLSGPQENFPEKPPTEAATGEVRPINEAGPTVESGGLVSGPSDEEVLASLTTNSES